MTTTQTPASFYQILENALRLFAGELEAYDPTDRVQPVFQAMMLTAKAFGIQPALVAGLARCSHQSGINWANGKPIPPQPDMRNRIRDVILAEVQARLRAIEKNTPPI